MSGNDRIADMLTRVRNALLAGKEQVEMPASRLLTSIARVLKEDGRIKRYEVVTREGKSVLQMFLYVGASAPKPFSVLTRASRSSKRTYVGYKQIPRPLGKFGLTILSTPKGVMRDVEAKKAGVGGEVLCYVY